MLPGKGGRGAKQAGLGVGDQFDRNRFHPRPIAPLGAKPGVKLAAGDHAAAAGWSARRSAPRQTRHAPATDRRRPRHRRRGTAPARAALCPGNRRSPQRGIVAGILVGSKVRTISPSPGPETTRSIEVRPCCAVIAAETSASSASSGAKWICAPSVSRIAMPLPQPLQHRDAKPRPRPDHRNRALRWQRPHRARRHGRNHPGPARRPHGPSRRNR